MNTQNRPGLATALAFIFLTFASCADHADISPNQAFKSADAPAMESATSAGQAPLDGAYERTLEDEADDVVGTGALQRKATTNRGQIGDRDLGGVGGGELTFPDDRLLEYTIYLTYRTEDYRAARQDLLQLAGKYGFIENSYAATEPGWSMSTKMRIRVAEMYTVLKELDGLGELEAERIEAKDHTEEMVLARRKSRRERLRLIRRNAAARQTPAANKNWAQREELISRSEDDQDQAEHEQWKIEDRVSFAQIQVQLLGPDLPVQVEVPAYQNAFVILFNWLLELLYVMILGAPLWLLLLAVWLKRAAIGRMLGINRASGETEQSKQH